MSNTFDDIFQTPYNELTAGQRHAHQTYLDFQRWADRKGPIDPGHASRGVIAFEGGNDGGYEYFSTDVHGDESRGAGLYDDYGVDYQSYPWAYPENPDFKNWWGGGGGGSSQVAEKAPEESRSVFDALETPDFSTKQSDDVLLGGSGSDDLTSFIPQQPAKIDKSSSVSVVDQLRNANADLQSVVGNQDLASFVNRVLSSANRGLSGSAGFVGGPAIEALRAGTFQAPTSFLAPQQAPQASTGTESRIENILVDVTSEQDPLEQIIEQTPDFELVTDVDGAADDSFDQSGGAFSEGESSSPTISGSDEDAFNAAEGQNAFSFADSIGFADSNSGFVGPNVFSFNEPFFGTEVTLSKQDVAKTAVEGVAKGFAAGAGLGFPGKAAVGALVDVLSGKNPEDIAKGLTFDTAGALLAGPMGPIAVPFAAGLETAYDIASSPYSGFGFGHFGSGFLSNLTSGAFGTSIDDQERSQEQFEENIEDYFTYTGSPKASEPPLGLGYIGRFADDWELSQFGRKNTPIKTLQEQIEKARRESQKEIEDFKKSLYNPFNVPTESEGGLSPTGGLSFSAQSVGVFGLDDGNWFNDNDDPFDSGKSGPSGGSFGGDPDAESGDPI